MSRWLTLSQAATLAGCSRKTLYRYMQRGLLAYRKEANNRRYVTEQDIHSLFDLCHNGTVQDSSTHDTRTIARRLEKIEQSVDEQKRLIMDMIALYHPSTLQDVARKHCAGRSTDAT